MILILATVKSTISTQINFTVTDAQLLSTRSDYHLVYITGSISTSQQYYDDMESKTNFMNEAESNIKQLLESNALIVDVLVSVQYKQEFTLAKQRKRSTGQTIEFTAICSVQVEEISDLEEIKNLISSTITKADPNLFLFFDKKSFLTFKLSIQKPKILTITSSSTDEITEKIGLFRKSQYKQTSSMKLISVNQILNLHAKRNS